MTEYDLFEPATENVVPFVVCGLKSWGQSPDGCGAVVANTPDAKQAHVEFHNKVER